MALWEKFHVAQTAALKRQFLTAVGNEAQRVFRNGMAGGHSGRIYGGHKASAAGEFPASRTGALAASIAVVVGQDQVEVGTGMPYSIYLRYGTGRMAKRRMSEDALRIAAENIQSGFGHFIGFEIG
jgi:phage gpG-like protein